MCKVHLIASVLVGVTCAPGAALAATRNYDIPAGSLEAALKAFTRQSGLQIIYQSRIVADRSMPRMRGRFDETSLLARLLGNTNLLASPDGSADKEASSTGPAPAATEPAPADTQPTVLEEIVVNAQKRNENLERVPIAITAISGDQLERASVRSSTDLTIVTPGLNYTEATGYAAPFLRGVGSNITGPGAESPIATYVDGVYYGSVSSTLLSLSDVQSIDVLKGPQGTLFGRNATGGVIQINTRSPDHDPEADFAVGYGNYETTDANAYLGGRLSNAIAGDLAVSYNHQNEGYGTNLFNAEPINKSQSFSARTKLLLQPLEGLKITLSGDYSSNQGSEGIAFRPVYGTLPEVGPPFTGGYQDINSSTQPFVDLKQGGGSIRIDYDTSTVKFVSITALRREHFQSAVDADMSAVPAATTATDAKTKQFTQEFQIISARQSPVSWVLGAYFFNNDGKDNPVVLSGLAYAPFNSLDFVAEQKASSQSAFGQVTVKVDSLTNLTGGLRYTREKRTFLSDQYGLYGEANVVVPFGIVDTDHVFEKLTWRLSIDRQIVSNTMLYASYNRGFKSGLYNVSSLSATPINPEVLDDYEVGIKSTLFGGRLRANSAFFYYNYKNLQIPQYIDGVQFLRNAASAEIYGVDADLELRATKSLHFTAGAEWLHARYKSFLDAPYGTPLPTGGNAISSREASRNDIMLSPALTLSVAADYTVDLGSSTLNAYVTYYYNDGWYGDPDNVLRQPAYSQLGGHLKWMPYNGAFSISVWGKNLNNSKSAQYLSDVAVGDVISVSPPRTFGVTLATKIK